MKTTIKSVTRFFTFEDEKGYEVYVEDFKDGFVEIDIPVDIGYEGNTIYFGIRGKEEFVTFISGCFAKESNFKEEVFKAYGCSPDTEFLGFKLILPDMSCIITKKNSSIFDIEKAIKDLVYDFIKNGIEEENKEIDEFKAKLKKLNELLERIDIEFKSDQAEEEYAERSEEKDEDSIQYAENFIALVQYFIGQGDGTDIAVNKTYKILNDLELIIQNDLEAIQFICKYCRYGDEIYNAYIDMQIKWFSDELTDF